MTRGWMDSARWWSLGFFVLLVVCLAWAAVGIRPLDGDNLYILTWAARAPLSGLAVADPQIYPQWRPLAFASVWGQYAAHGLGAMPAYFIVNLVLWALCGWRVQVVVQRLTGHRYIALLAGVLLVVDPRAVKTLTWIDERQTSMACLFVLLALERVLAGGDRRLRSGEMVATGSLLLAAALCKEYGLAAAGAVLALSLWERRTDLGLTAGAAMVIYALARFTIARGAVGEYCETVGYFGLTRDVCYDGSRASMLQMTYNVAATALGTLVDGFFAADGHLQLHRRALLMSAPLLAAVAIGSRSGRPARLAWLLLLGNAGLSILLYRSRNHLVAVSGLMVLVGCGAALVYARSGSRGRVAICVLLAGVALARGAALRAAIADDVQSFNRGEPCWELAISEWADRDIVRQVKLKYGMADPSCAGRSR